jgi:hypothetical protein
LQRKVWIEPLFAEGKLWHGMRRFRTRTLEEVNTEALITATARNTKRLLAFGRRGPNRLSEALALRPPERPHDSILLSASLGNIAGHDASTHAFQHAGSFVRPVRKAASA